ncbi:hypothetical protein C8J27_11018 [Rhodobacter aestuarii]|uniref:Uncharacterized protein n=1 Tax=Rhodobacter aestuarii TaxID=453582 RepID=A0A1N7PZC7_9RHOB|nr:hypothetical protein [Rhodobacter aestuarii]PTV93969.1 hypothetical protein C8J27_11018 [Rhodobacter aestuarii]SIT15936.1 hypothetical protein SAMN05421580_11218 [Rhodobacter aestuarii]
MALSNAEKVRRYRERQKAKKQAELKKPSTQNTAVFQKPFFEVFTLDDQYDSQYANSLELAGIQPLYFEDDSGPESVTLDDLGDLDADEFSNPFGASRGSSLGKAEVLIGCMLDAASDLADRVNEYKINEIRARIAEIENSDLSDPETKRAAFATVTELNAMIAELRKEFRFSLPRWKADIFFGTVEEWMVRPGGMLDRMNIVFVNGEEEE